MIRVRSGLHLSGSGLNPWIRRVVITISSCSSQKSDHSASGKCQLNSVLVHLSVKRAATGDFDEDSKYDVTLAYQYPSSTRFHVFLSIGSSFTYQGNGGWWYSTGYPLSNVRGIVAGHFSGTGAAKMAGQDESLQTLPTTITLNQNYPNPFNPVTTISYSLPEAVHVELCVYNILGQKVQTLVDEYQTPGEHIATWNASPKASGIYFYRVWAGDCEESKKMILLK